MATAADLERLFERFFDRSTARLFRARLQPVQLERRVERAMERARTSTGGRIIVPGRYRVRLHPDDLGALAPDPDAAGVLAARLAGAALAFARQHAYHLPGPPIVALVADPALARGTVEVDAAPAPAPAPASRAVEPPAVEPAPAHPVVDLSAAIAEPPGSRGIRGDGSQTLVFRRPVPVAPGARLRVCAPDGTERTVEVDGSPLTMGRSRDNRLVLVDPRVSRQHGRLQARRGALVYTDLGSTNGSRVNGLRVDEIALGLGDRIQVGDTVLVVEQLPG
jgi:hypothetical protein